MQKDSVKLKIGILGCRGIPNAYGGFEQFAEKLSVGLVNKGHDVAVYNSSSHPYLGNEWHGVKIIRCKDPEGKLGTVGQFFYDLNCILDARKRDFDVLLQLGYTSSSIWHRLWPDTVNLVNMDGLEWKRSKYSRLTRIFLKKAERWAAMGADHLVADSTAIQDYLLTTYRRKATYIPYGAEIFEHPDPSRLIPFNIQPGDYYLLIARMEPENNIEAVIKGYLDSGQSSPLLIVGGLNKYGRHLRKKYNNPGVRFPGAIYDKLVLDDLRHFSRLYFHGHSVGGTNPSLLEAMACGCTIAAHDNLFNKLVLGDNAVYFRNSNNVRNIFLTQNPSAPWKQSNFETLRKFYQWEDVIDSYERLMLETARR